MDIPQTLSTHNTLEQACPAPPLGRSEGARRTDFGIRGREPVWMVARVPPDAGETTGAADERSLAFPT
jgi:hypothetical protein